MPTPTPNINAEKIQGNLYVTTVTASIFSGSSFTGSLQGTSSFATSASFAISSSRAISSSFTTSASFATTSSYSETSKLTNNAYFAQGILAADQVINPGTDIVVEFVSQYDPQGWWDNGTFQFTPTVEGYYRVSLGVWWQDPNDNSNQLNAQIRSNGSTQEMIIQQPSTNIPSGISLFGTKIIYFNGAGDFIDFTVYNGTPIGQKIQQGSSQGSGTWFSAEYMTM